MLPQGPQEPEQEVRELTVFVQDSTPQLDKTRIIFFLMYVCMYVCMYYFSMYMHVSLHICMHGEEDTRT